MSGEMKNALQKAGIKTDISQQQCPECGESFVPKESFHKVCFKCHKKRQAGGSVSQTSGYLHLRSDYLSSGYFDGKGYLREGIFKDDAKEVANILASQRMTPTSLRAFYNKVKAIESEYKMSNNFDAIKSKLYAFERDVAYQISRGVVNEEFRKFIVKNAELAVKGPKEFKGFVEHFLSVLSYFKDVSK